MTPKDKTQKTKKEIMREVARELYSPFVPYSVFMIEHKTHFAASRAQGFISSMLHESTYSGFQAERLDDLIDSIQKLISRTEQTLAALRNMREQIKAAPDDAE